MSFTLFMIWWYSIVLVLKIVDKAKEETPVTGVRFKIDHKYFTPVTNQNTELRPEDYLASHDESILMYNRVPKTGSSSMKTMLINLAKVCEN